MTSPFSSFGNAVLEFQVDSGALSQSPSGVSVPIQERVTVEAVLEKASDRATSAATRPQFVPGGAIMLKGFLISPLSTSAARSPFERLVTERTKCKAVVNGQAGQFWLNSFVMDPFEKSVGVFIASKLSGWFVPGAAVTIVGVEAT